MDVLNFWAMVDNVSPTATVYSPAATIFGVSVGEGCDVAVSCGEVGVTVAVGARGVRLSAVGMAAIVAAMRVWRFLRSGVGVLVLAGAAHASNKVLKINPDNPDAILNKRLRIDLAPIRTYRDYR